MSYILVSVIFISVDAYALFMSRWPLNKTYFWESAPFFRILLPFAAGIWCYGLDPVLPAYRFMLPVAGIALLLHAAIVYAKKTGGIYTYISFLSLYAFVFVGGVAVSYYSDVQHSKAWFGHTINAEHEYLVKVTGTPLEKEHTWKVPVSVTGTMADGKVSLVKGDAFVYIYKDAAPVTLQKGDSVLVPGRWSLISNAGNPFEFDYARYCRRNNIYYQQVCAADDIKLFAAGNAAAQPLTEKMHVWCMQQLDIYLKDTIARGLVQAMLLGDEVHLDEELRQSYSATGIIHIIAISGGNVAIFFIVISVLLWWLRHKKYAWIKFAVALPLVWFYVLMAGAPPSAVRAAVMFSLLAVSVMLQKNNNSLNQLFATAFLLLCAYPSWLYAIGFQLSFTAVLSLILFYTPVYKWVSPVNKIAQKLWGTVAASIAAEVLVAPLVIYYFHTFPLLFIVANVIAYLFMGLVLILGICIIVLSFVPAVAAAIGTATVWLVTVFDRIVLWLQSFNPESFSYLMLNGAEVVLLYLVITGIAVFLLHRQKKALFTGLGAGCILLLLLCSDEWEQLHQRKLVVYNAGKTNHIEVINGSRHAVVTTDTANRKKVQYAVKPAHIAWHAWREETIVNKEVFYINGKKVLVLNEAIQEPEPFPVDKLVINFKGKADLHKLKKAFSPAVIVVGNNMSRKEQERLVSAGAMAGIQVHAVADKGAFVVN